MTYSCLINHPETQWAHWGWDISGSFSPMLTEPGADGFSELEGGPGLVTAGPLEAGHTPFHPLAPAPSWLGVLGGQAPEVCFHGGRFSL